MHLKLIKRILRCGSNCNIFTEQNVHEVMEQQHIVEVTTHVKNI
jgi:hypothetical protein